MRIDDKYLMSATRNRYLVRSPKILSLQSHIGGGDWSRTNARAWRKYRGEKKVVSGRAVLAHAGAMPGWE